MSPETRTRVRRTIWDVIILSLFTAGGIIGSQAFNYGILTQRVYATESSIKDIKEDLKGLHDADLKLKDEISKQAIDLAPVEVRLKRIEERQDQIINILTKRK